MHDYLKFYDLERYLFENVHGNFHKERNIGAFDFFSIIIWKANRAKSLMARKLLKHDPKRRDDLDVICRDLTSKIFQASNGRERLRILFEDWSFALPMASAILTVLYPDEFTIYDVRICGNLNEFHNLSACSHFENLWSGYVEFRERVKNAAPREFSLRDQDRYLWGQSAVDQLKQDINRKFNNDS